MGDGFLCLWDMQEPVSFFAGSLEPLLTKTLYEQFGSGKRYREKLAAHFILQQFDRSVILDNTNRKPEVNHGHVSVSHTLNNIAVMYNHRIPVGVDIESTGARVLKIRHKFLNAAELVFCGDDIMRCLVCWAAKESVFKHKGRDTGFFNTNIHIMPFTVAPNFTIEAKVTVLGEPCEMELVCELFNGFIMVYTL